MTPSDIAGLLESQHKYDKAHYPPANPLFAQAAATIRAQAEALKIATEALEVVEELSEEILIETHAAIALDRIKEIDQ